MKSALFFAALTSFCLTSSQIWAQTTVYILAGQSNMDGRADISNFDTAYQPTLSSVDYYYGTDPGGSDATPNGVLTTIRGNTSETSKTGPEVSLAYYMDAAIQNDIAFIKYANGGSGFSDGQWLAGGDNTTTGDGLDYRRLQNIVTSGLSALQTASPLETFDIGGFVWIQGERDAVQSSSTATYQANLTTFISDVRSTYGNDLPFYYSRLSDNQTSLNSTSRSNIQTAQDNVNSLVSNTYLVNTDTFSVSTDNLHFDADGFTSLGEGLGEIIVSSSVPEPSSALYLCSALGILFLRRRQK